MRINRETLLKLANETVVQRSRADRGILAAYLCGALLTEDYLLGGTADIDLVFIHLDRVNQEREIVRLSDEVHVDIAHHYQKDYQQKRALRLHPWLGPTIESCRILYDPQHFMDFTQASVRGQFDRSDYVLARARKQSDHARQMWFSFSTQMPDPGPKELAQYLRAVEHAANSVAGLSGSPLTERRFLLRFPERAAAVKRPGLQAGLLGLLGAPNVEPGAIGGWIQDWQRACESATAAAQAAGASVPARLHPYRFAYYRHAFQSILQRDEPRAALWPLLRTWTEAAGFLEAGTPEFNTWRAVGEQLGLLGPAFGERVSALDAFLDMVDETQENWAKENGAVY